MQYRIRQWNTDLYSMAVSTCSEEGGKRWGSSEIHNRETPDCRSEGGTGRTRSHQCSRCLKRDAADTVGQGRWRQMGQGNGAQWHLWEHLRTLKAAGGQAMLHPRLRGKVGWRTTLRPGHILEGHVTRESHLQVYYRRNVVVHTFNPRSWKTDTQESPSLRPAWITW